MAKRVLFLRAYFGINIHSDAQGELGIHLNTRDVFPDLTLITAATIFNESGKYDVKVIDAVIENKMLPDELLKKLSKDTYDIVIMKVSKPTIRSDIEVAKEIKKMMPNTELIFGGHTVKLLKKWISENVKEIDTVIEEPLDEFAVKYVGLEIDEKGIINSFPTPDYKLVDYMKYVDDEKRVRLTLQAGRGCPLACKYCPYKMYYSGVELRDVDLVIEDMKKLVEIGAQVIQFRDQYFSSDKKRIKRLCERIIEENIKVEWICETRLMSLDKELLDLLKKAGVILICFGVESGDQELLKLYDSNKGQPDKMKEIIGYANSLGIITMAFYIIGFPEETWENAENTYKYADYLDSKYAIFNEYENYQFDSPDISPEIFTVFENTTTIECDSVLNNEEVKYLVWLYSILYTMRMSFEEAYRYNYKIVIENKRIIKKMQPYASDLMKLCECVRAIWASDESGVVVKATAKADDKKVDAQFSLGTVNETSPQSTFTQQTAISIHDKAWY